MKISILGGGGFLGRKIAARLATDRKLGDQPVTGLTLFDIAAPPKPDAAFPITSVAGDILELPPDAIPAGTDVVFHLAAVVSAQAEADYELGRRVNLRGTDALIDACRRIVAAGGKPPRVVFTSSVASFSGGQDAVLDDDARQVPANSYGAQKAAAELILADASRRGFLDVVSIRLPTVIVRPGRPNRAASSFLSSIIREPLLGLPADLPVPDDFAAWICSPRRGLAAARGSDGHVADGAGSQHQPAWGQHDHCAPAPGTRRGAAGSVIAGQAHGGQGDCRHCRAVAALVRGDARPHVRLCHS
jgi:nucleoside-diphosphate-sugar epimerase